MPEGRGSLADVPQSRAHTKKRARPSIVWIVPIVAALVGGWVAVRRILDEGPTITIQFRTGEGLEAGKTKVKFKGVEIGTLTSLGLSGDHQTVTGTAQMAPHVEKLLLEDTKFWVVKPRISGANVSGLSTLISGSYVAMDLGKTGSTAKASREFVAMNNAPLVYADSAGRFFTLKAPDLGSLDTGTPLFFRRLQVGQVASYELDKDGQSLIVKVFINAPYDQYVNPDTRFWNASGIDVSLSANGLTVQTQSAMAVLVGGIAFETPSTGTVLPEAEADAEFALYHDRSEAFRPPARDPQTYQLVFKQSVRGLAPGAPVEFRGIPIGEVESVDSRLDADTYEFSAPVTIRLDAQRLGMKVAELPPGADPAPLRRSLIDNLIAHGVRAQLQTGSLVTGSMYVAFDTFPKAPAVTVDWSQTPVQLPTIPGQFEEMEASVGHIISKLDQVPLDEIGEQVKTALVELNRTLVVANGTLGTAQGALVNANRMVEPNSAFTTSLDTTLQSVNDAARSVRVLADYLERHPESLLRGKTGDAK